MKDGSESLRKGREQLVQDVNTVLDDAQELLRQAVGEAGKGYSEARARLENSLRTARDRMGSLDEAVLGGAAQVGRDADSYVRRHPWESIGVGAAIGLLLGVLIARH